MALTRHAGELTIEDKCSSPWHYLPVEVPAGSSALKVELHYKAAGTAVLDLGCFDPTGFRGWSGGARRSFLITAKSATPGYLPGELAPGTWQVVLGLHRIPADGVRYELTAEATSAGAAALLGSDERIEPPLTEHPPHRDLPAPPGLRWLAGDLHSHTVHSDGVLTVPELARFAAGRGLDFLAVTDHNTISHHHELPAAADAYQIALVPGQEVTTEQGHANAFGDLSWIDFREPPDAWLEATEHGGGLLSINHPYGGQVSWTSPMRRRPPLIEIWHWSWLDLRWTAPLSWWLAWHPDAIAVGGSDWHRPGSDAPPGSPTTWVLAEEPATTPILDGVASGNVAISASRDGPLLLRVEGELVAVNADGAILVNQEGPIRRVSGDLATLGHSPGYHRITDPDGATLALTN
ncbi:MAG TPA: CehA/McbA family metallohydrolase [Streptosporangiaceae bacterium]|nr:CehA/McbA family metallohydrolase [Streptosporangiaceae bacterium]